MKLFGIFVPINLLQFEYFIADFALILEGKLRKPFVRQLPKNTGHFFTAKRNLLARRTDLTMNYESQYKSWFHYLAFFVAIMGKHLWKSVKKLT